MPRSSRLSRFAVAALLPVALALHAAPGSAASSRKDGFVRVLVKLRAHASALRFQALDAERAQTLRPLHVRVLSVPRRDAAALVSRLRASRSVDYAEIDRVVMSVAGADAIQATPSDPLWPQQWGATLTGAPTAWAVTTGTPSVIVAVLDTGVDASHPDLQGALVPGYDFVNGDADPSDDYGHGTAVAGVVGARADNGLGGAGFCASCSIMPVKVAAADGTATESDVAEGIVWAADHGARVINLSLGGSYGATVASAVEYATGRGVLVVAAAGNNGNSTRFYPAADAGVLSVGATQPDDTLYSWSNYGDWVAVAAPGCDVATVRGGGYGEICGTSASTPVVSGLAGLAISFAPSASADVVKQAITSTAHRIDRVTYGRVDVAATLAALGAVFKTAPAVAPQPVPASPLATPVRRGSRRFASAALRAVGTTRARHVARRRAISHAVRKKTRRRPRPARAQRDWLLAWVGLEEFGRRY